MVENVSRHRITASVPFRTCSSVDVEGVHKKTELRSHVRRLIFLAFVLVVTEAGVAKFLRVVVLFCFDMIESGFACRSDRRRPSKKSILGQSRNPSYHKDEEHGVRC